MGYTLSSHCITRWIERHDFLLEFINDLPAILKSLTEISTWLDTSTSSKANSLCKVIQDREIVTSIFCLNDIMCLTRSLSILLQTKNLDLYSASTKIKQLREVLGNKRKNVNQNFNIIFKKVNEIMSKLGSELKLPRTVGRQVNRCNIQTDFYDKTNHRRVSIYIPILDEVIQDFDVCFSTKNMQCFNLYWKSKYLSNIFTIIAIILFLILINGMFFVCYVLNIVIPHGHTVYTASKYDV